MRCLSQTMLADHSRRRDREELHLDDVCNDPELYDVIASIRSRKKKMDARIKPLSPPNFLRPIRLRQELPSRILNIGQIIQQPNPSSTYRTKHTLATLFRS